MKIMLITDLYPISDNEKYTPKTLLNFVKCWEADGHEVTVVKPNFLFNSVLRKKPLYKEGIYNNIINLNYYTPFFNPDKLLKYCNLSGFDIFIAHMPTGILFADKLNVKYTAAVHISDIEVLTNPLYKIYFKHALKTAYKNAQSISARSSVLKQKFLQLFPEYEPKTFTAPSGISEEIIIKRIVTKSPIKILTCAQLIKRKNIDKLIYAVNKIPEISLTVIGNGPEYKRLKKLARGNILFKGYCPHNEVLNEMRKSDIFILPSVNETFGMVYLEAMASGCITVGIKDEGIDGIIQHGINGFLINEPKSDKIIEIINYIVNCKHLQTIADNAYNTVISHIDRVCAKNCLQQIIKFNS